MSFTVLKNYNDDTNTNESYPTSVTYENNGVIYGSISNYNIINATNKGSLFTYNIYTHVYTPDVYIFTDNDTSWYPLALTYTNNILYGSSVLSNTGGNGTLFTYDFITSTTQVNVTDLESGFYPIGLSSGTEQYIYGCFYFGGGANEGLLFKYDIPNNAIETLFTCGNVSPNPAALTYYNGKIYE